MIVMRVLLEDAAAPAQLTPDYLSRAVCPYLSALGVLQTVADAIREHPEPLVIQQITGENGRIVACVDGACGVIDFAVREIPSWRGKHAADLAELRTLDEMLTWLTDGGTREAILIEREALCVDLQPDLLRLVLGFLSAVSPEAPELGQIVHIDRLLAAFQLLAFSAITLAVLNA
jgi:hypothetical protein